MQSLARKQIVFTLGLLVLGCLEAVIAGWWIGLPGVEGVAYSIVLCLIPGWLTIFAVSYARSSEQAASIALLGTGLRIAFVLTGLLLVRRLRNDLRFREFDVWLVVGYQVALGLETWIALADPLQGMPAKSKSEIPKE